MAKRPTVELQEDADLRALLKLPAFNRFLLRIHTASGIGASAYGSDDRNLQAKEGRRSLGFDIFSWCDAAASWPSNSALIAALTEGLQPPGDSNATDDDDPAHPLYPDRD